LVSFVIFAEKVMIVVSTREFRANQTKVLSAAKNGQSIVLTSRLGNFKIVPISEDDKIVEEHLLAANAEVKDHLQGTVELPLAKDLDL
jgi:antitoxin (DNA-binding transcriptional repressor) of toxin-antitoxin stability system